MMPNHQLNHSDRSTWMVIPLDHHSCRATNPTFQMQYQDGLLTETDVARLSHIWFPQEHAPQGLLVCLRCGTPAACPICCSEPPPEALRVLCLACHASMQEIQRLHARSRLLLSSVEERRAASRKEPRS